MHIENFYKIISVYTADVSGVCSALYELGGMVVMHDPSGCNSTYNTHDETRWYDQDSLIYISALTEIDAVMGNDRKLIDDVVDAARRLNPKFIALASSPVPFLNGTDFKAICRIIEKETGIKTFFVETNGTHDYTVGAGRAMLEIARQYVKPAEKVESCEKSSERKARVNILGLTPLDFAWEGAAADIKNAVKAAGFDVVSGFLMDSSLEEISSAAAADVNLVVSETGLLTAKFMQEQFGIPYVCGFPAEAVAEQVYDALRSAAETGESRLICSESRSSEPNASEGTDIIIIGEPVVAGSLARSIENAYFRKGLVISPLEGSGELLGEGDKHIKGELPLEEALKNLKPKAVIADPLYEPVIPAGSELIKLPHQAFSGRCFMRNFDNLLAGDDLFKSLA